MNSKLIRGTAEDGQFRFFIGETTQLVEKARKIHETTAVSSAALGRLITASSMMGTGVGTRVDTQSIFLPMLTTV